MWQWLSENSAALQALASAVLAVLALVAAIVAGVQVSEARKLRRAQAQPYVAAGMRQSVATGFMVEVFFRNYGTTAAHNVRVMCDPPLTAEWGSEEVGPVPLFDVLPTMVPGEEWATLWDSATTRWDSGQEMSSTVVLTWEDAHKNRFSGKYILDWDAHKGRQFISQKGMDDLAKAVMKISDSLNRAVQGQALIVQTKEDQRAEMDARRAQLLARRTAVPDSGVTGPGTATAS